MLINYLCTLKPQIAFYASCGDGFMGGPDRAYLESYNSGNSWISCSDGLEHHYLYSMAIDPADCNTISFLPHRVQISLITVFLMNLIFIVKRKIPVPASTTRTTICNRYSHFDVCDKRSRTTYILHFK